VHRKHGERPPHYPHPGKPAWAAGTSNIPSEFIFYGEGGETLEQAAQRGGRCPIPGDIQGQAEQGSEQPGLVEDVPAHCRGVGLDDL